MRTTKTEAGKEFFQPFEEGRRTRLDLEVRSEQVRLLYSPSLTSAIATIFVVVFMTYLHWDVVNRTILLTWATVASLMILARVIAYFAYFRLNPGIEETAKWERISVATAVVASVAWGSAGVFLFPSGDFARQMATLIILIGVASGGVTTLSALRTPVMVFLPSTMLPVTFHLLQHKTEVSIPVGIMCLMYTVFLGNNANHTYKTHLQNITLRLKSRNEEKAIRKSEETVRQTAEILKLIAAGEPAEGIFNAIARLYESRHTGVRCFILRLEGGRLRCDGTPSLPAEFCRAVDRLNYSPRSIAEVRRSLPGKGF